MTNLIILTIIFIFSIFFSQLFKKKIEETVIFSVFIIILFLYICGLFSILNIGWYLICVSSFVFIFFLLRNYKNFKPKLLLTYGFIFIIITTSISLIIHKYRVVITFDEFNHWFLAVKNMYINNELFTSSNSNVLSKDYTPISTIFHYFWMKPSPHFDESLVFISMNFFIFSLLAPVLSVFKRKQWKKALLAGFFLFLIPLTLYDYIYTGAYVDGLMGLIFAYILYLYFIKKPDKINLISIFLALIVLTLTKMTGIIFSMAAVIIIIIDILFFTKIKKNATNTNKK